MIQSLALINLVVGCSGFRVIGILKLVSRLEFRVEGFRNQSLGFRVEG